MYCSRQSVWGKGGGGGVSSIYLAIAETLHQKK